MRIPSGVTDQYIYFVAVDSTDFTTRETGLSSFTVYRSRNGAAAAAMTTPTVNETDATNMPGVYELLCDEDMTIDAGDDSQEMVFHITATGMAPVTRTIELYRPKITAGNTLDVTSTGAAGIDWGNVENATTTVDLSATSINLCDTVTTNTDMRGTDSALLASSAPTNFGDLSITATTGRVDLASIAGTAQTANDNGADINTLLTRIVGTLASGTHNAQSGDAFARLGAPAGASVSADIATVDTVVDGIQTDLSNGTDGLGAIKADTAAILIDTSTTLENHLTDIKGATFSGATDSLEAIRNRGDTAWITGAGGSADTLLVLDTTIASVTSQTQLVLTAGAPDDDVYDNFLVIFRDAATSNQVSVRQAAATSSWASGTLTLTIQTAPDFTVAATDIVEIYATVDAEITGTIDANLVQIGGDAQSMTDLKDFADAGYDPATNKVQGVVLVDTTTTNTDMRGTDGANTTTPPTAAQNADQVWDELQSAHVTVGSFGEIAIEIASILADTNELQTDWENGGRLDLILDGIQADLDNGTDGLGALLTAINANATPAEVLTQVNAALDTAISELGVGVPAATPTLRTGLMLLYMALRNKLDVDATSKQIHNNAGAVIASKGLSDDGTTYSEAQAS